MTLNEVSNWMIVVGIPGIASAGAWGAYRAAVRSNRRERDRDELAARLQARVQAEKVDLTFGTWEAETNEVDDVGDPAPGDVLQMAKVANGSQRPIRQLVCVLADGSGAIVPASQSGRYLVSNHPGLVGQRIMDPQSGGAVDVIRAGDEYGFIFDVKASALTARMSVMFTDDTETRWRIDHDLHLERIDDGQGEQ
jgi:hypothetical protein